MLTKNNIFKCDDCGTIRGSNEEISVNDQLDVRIIKRLVLYLYTNDGNVSKISRQFLGASSEEKDRFIEILESMGKDIQ